MTRPLTDFELFGYAGAPISCSRRSWALTVDFEAFRARDFSQWSLAMERWAQNALASRLSFSFFVAIENVVQLKLASRAAYDQLLSAVAALADASTSFYPHNHYLFDFATGRRPRSSCDFDAAGGHAYRKRPSFFFDVVRRHRIDLAGWLSEVKECHAHFLAEAGLAPSGPDVFRAGGWDCGSDRHEVGMYLGALAAAGFDIDSSATAGEFATRNWRIGAPFGSNVFPIGSGLLEIAPCWSLNCGAPVWSRSFADSVRMLARQRSLWEAPFRQGLLVTVIHFDHLFRGEPATDQLLRRIDTFFTRLRWLRQILSLTCMPLDQVGLPFV